jgi:hypothetical protein
MQNGIVWVICPPDNLVRGVIAMRSIAFLDAMTASQNHAGKF